MSLKIITDSACDLPGFLLKQYDVDILPFLIHIEDQEYVDGKTITSDQVYNSIRAGKVPTTAQVPIDMLLTTFTKYAKQNQPCLYLSFSSKLSGTYNTACLVAQEIKKTYPHFQLNIIDTLSGSLGQGLIVLEAAKLAQGGLSPKEILTRVQIRSQNNMEHIFSVNDLNYLYRGGRVSYTNAFLGGLLNVKPILHVQDGAMIPIQKVRGSKMAIKRIAELVKERSLGNPNQVLAISHADDPNLANELQYILRDKLGYKNIIINVVGSVLACHIGLGGVATFFINAKNSIPNVA